MDREVIRKNKNNFSVRRILCFSIEENTVYAFLSSNWIDSFQADFF